MLPSRSTLLFLFSLTIPGLAAGQAPASSAASPAANEAFYRAYYLESGLRDFESAIAAYAAIAADPKSEKAVVVAAEIGRARCLQALGKIDDARKQLEAALLLDPNNAEAKRLIDAKANDGIDPELRVRLSALVAKLGGAEREQAASDLKKVGDLKLPFLDAGLRSRDVAVVEGCANVLAEGDEEAFAILARALQDPRVLFQASLASIFFKLPHSAAAFSVCEAALESQEVKVRVAAVQWTLSPSTKKMGIDAARLTKFLSRAVDDSSMEVSRALRDFGRIDDPEVIAPIAPRLAAMLEKVDPESKRQAIQSVRVGSSAALDSFLWKMLEDPDDRVREFAVNQARLAAKNKQLSVAAAIETLVPRLSDSSVAVSSVAIGGLNELHADLDATGLAMALDLFDRRTRVENYVDGNLLYLITHAKSVSDSDLVRVWNRILEQRDRLGDDVTLQSLYSFASNLGEGDANDENRRTQFLLARFAEAKAEFVEGLVLKLFSKNYQSDPLTSAKTVAALLHSQHPTIRRAAYRRPPESASGQVLWEPFSDPIVIEHTNEDLLAVDPLISGSALYFADWQAGPQFAPSVTKWIADKRSLNAAQLGFVARCIGRDALPILREELQGKIDIWSIACFHLLRLTGEESIPAILASLGSDPERLTALLDRFSGLLRSDKLIALPAVEKFISTSPIEVWSSAMLVHPALLTEVFPPLVTRALDSADAQVRSQGCSLAANWRLEGVEPRLVVLLDDPNAGVAAGAERALDAIRAKREARTAAKLATSFDRSKTIDEARALLSSDDPVKRRGGALALGALGDVAALPALLKLLDDKDPQVREAALTAMSKLDGSPHAPSSPPTKDG